MSQIVDGFYSVLNSPLIYELFQNMVGVRSFRRRFITEFVKPFPGAKILDIGCGPGRILDYMPDDIQYVGCDINPEYIKYAKKKYHDRAQFHCVDIKGLTEFRAYTSQFDIALAMGVVHHLDDEDVRLLFKNVSLNLKNGGVLVTLDCVYEPSQSKIAQYIISKDRGQNIREREEYLKLTEGIFSSGETVILSDMLRIPYTHFIMRLHNI